jgi:metallo-beta-lactamase family protein
MIKIKFNGAAKTVTGSNYFVETDNGNFVVDAGMFQGPDVEHLNLEGYNFDAKSVKFTLLTHAHIDHSGMLPKLYKAGATGPIYATNHTIQISTELLLDSAKIQENSYQRGEFYGKYTNIKALVYNNKDATDTIAQFRAVSYNDQFEPIPGIKLKYMRTGHILGAASIEVDIEDEGTTKKIIFSGDIGRKKTHIDETFDAEYRSEADVVLMESLYGGAVHPDRDESAKELIRIISETIKNRGNVFIPCFAVQRTQEVLNDMKIAKENGSLAKDVPVWLDSPLAQRVTGIYSAALQNTENDPFNFPNLIYTRKYRQSQQITKTQGNVIMAGSGMADGGRIQDHLVKGLENPKNAVIFVGFQAEGTLGRELVEGEKRVTIGKNNVKVNAQIYHLEGFSAHGDTNDYLAWINCFSGPKLKKLFLVHAEEERALAMKSILESKGFNQGYIPGLDEEIVL